MSGLEQIGSVSLSNPDVEPVAPRNGITFRFRHEGYTEVYDVALSGCDLDRVVFSDFGKTLGVVCNEQYSHQIIFPKAINSLFMACRTTKGFDIKNGQLARDFEAFFKIGAKSIGFYQCGELSATRTVSDGWKDHKLRLASIYSPYELLSEERSSYSILSPQLT